MLNVFICYWTLKMFKSNGWWVLLPSVIYFHLTIHQWSSYSIVLSWTQHILLDQSMVERSRTWDSPKTNDATMWIVDDSLTVLDFSSSAMIKVCIVMRPISYDWSYTERRSHFVLIDRRMKELADIFGEKKPIDNSTISLLFVIIECSSSYWSHKLTE
jgi:hypothetical protein